VIGEARLLDVPVDAYPPERWREVLGDDGLQMVLDLAERGRRELGDAIVWNVNSTPRGGGVAEMLGPLVGQARGAGVDARWVVIEGDPAFFTLTKRIHNRLHGAEGDGGPLSEVERGIYEMTTARNAEAFRARVRPGDVALLHDPQTAGLVPHLADCGVAVIWRCHVGVDEPNACTRDAWNFLAPYLQDAGSFVFSRRDYAWDVLDADRVTVIRPSIDAFAAKNRDMDDPAAILSHCGLLSGDGGPPRYRRDDGSEHLVERRFSVTDGAPVAPGTPLVTQVSRWDSLKDPLGIIEAFGRHIARQSDAHLVLAGPDVTAVADDPEGLTVLTDCHRMRDGLPAEVAARVHLIALPMEDREENAAMVNALQRHSHVVVQKSLAEGFGLTVAEGMWKSRPVVGGRVGGIQDQIEDGVSGTLVDPRDLDAFADGVLGLLGDRPRADAIGQAAHLRVRKEFLGPRHLSEYVALFERVRHAQ
jgi:trehalose synthase